MAFIVMETPCLTVRGHCVCVSGFVIGTPCHYYEGTLTRTLERGLAWLWGTKAGTTIGVL